MAGLREPGPGARRGACASPAAAAVGAAAPQPVPPGDGLEAGREGSAGAARTAPGTPHRPGRLPAAGARTSSGTGLWPRSTEPAGAAGRAAAAPLGMAAASLAASRIWTVTELTARIRHRLESDARLQQVWVRGEINSCKRHSSGHLYFTLQDEGASLRCVMFRSAARHLPFLPEDGMAVVAAGRIGVYEPGGVYQLYVETLEPDGLGALYLALEQRKRRLQQEGLFDPARKRPLPRLPRCIGVVTSADGAALRDIIRVATRRNPRVRLVVAPVPVQGEGAAEAIAAAIRRFDRWGQADVLIVGRGGGAREDLWAFNEEVVVRAVAAASVPVISAVGHEVDVTLCDLAADVRAPTPSAAAELAVPEWAPLVERVQELHQRLAAATRARLREARHHLARLAASRGLQHPRDRLERQRQRVQDLHRELARQGRLHLARERQRLEAAAGRLQALSPLAVLARGYSITRDAAGRIVRDAAAVTPGDPIEVLLARGRLQARVERVEGEEREE